MSNITELNEAPVLDQTREHYTKLFAVLVWKLQKAGTHPDGVTITYGDLVAYNRAFDRGECFLLAHGHHDSFEFKNVTAERAAELAKWNATQKGNA